MGLDTLDTPSAEFRTPFEITAGDTAVNPDGKSANNNSYYVNDGVIFSNFSFASGSFVHIQGLREPQEFKAGSKFYIEMDVLPNLQIEKAVIKCGEVGSKGSWPTYPDMYDVEPKDEIGSDGQVTKYVHNKMQTKCYVLIGYRVDDKQKDRAGTPQFSVKEENGDPVQILNSDIIMMASVLSGIPIIFPMPYFNGTAHYQMLRSGTLY